MAKRWGVLLGFAAACASAGCSMSPRAQSAFDASANAMATFQVDGAPLCFVGANNYYLSYEPYAMVDDVLDAAHALGMKVVRTWSFIDRGSLDERVPPAYRPHPSL